MSSICKKCSTEFTPVKGLINYCSLACRNTNPPSSVKTKNVQCTIWSIAFVSSEYLTKGIPNLLRGSRTTPPIEPINMDV